MIQKPLSDLFYAMNHGKYDFNDFMHGPIEENYETFQRETQGSLRKIFRPNKKLKVYHTFLNLFIFEYLPINEEIVFSYRKGFSVYHAVSKHSAGKYFFQTDISSFFANIDRQLIRRTILAGKNACPVIDVEDMVERILNLVCIEDALPVGFPASAPISNAVLYTFDNELQKYCEKFHLIYTRYADDIVISSQSKEAIENIEQEIQNRLEDCASNKLLLNAKKSKYFQIGGKVKILGMMILPNGKITIDSKLKSEMEVILYFYLNNKEKFLDFVNNDEPGALGRITGFLNYANSVDQEYLNKLRRKFGATIIDTLIRRPLT